MSFDAQLRCHLRKRTFLLTEVVSQSLSIPFFNALPRPITNWQFCLSSSSVYSLHPKQHLVLVNTLKLFVD